MVAPESADHLCFFIAAFAALAAKNLLEEKTCFEALGPSRRLGRKPSFRTSRIRLEEEAAVNRMARFRRISLCIAVQRNVGSA